MLIWIKNGSLELTDRIYQEQNAVLLWTTTNLVGKECVQFDLTFHFSLPCLHCLEASGHNVPLWTVFKMNAVATVWQFHFLFLQISFYEPTDLNGGFIDRFVFFCRDGRTLFEYLETNHGVTTVFIYLKTLVETHGFIVKSESIVAFAFV